MVCKADNMYLISRNLVVNLGDITQFVNEIIYPYNGDSSVTFLERSYGF